MNLISGRLQRKGDKILYCFALIVLWSSVIVGLACDWVTVGSGFVVNNSSPDNIINGLSLGPTIVNAISGLIYILLSDAILVRPRDHILITA